MPAISRLISVVNLLIYPVKVSLMAEQIFGETAHLYFCQEMSAIGASLFHLS
jgi:hypothetical protein